MRRHLALLAAMKFDLLWYVPLSLLVVYYIVVQNAVSGYENIRLVIGRFFWGIIFSPSTYFFFGSILVSVILPIQLLLLIPMLFNKSDAAYRRRYLWSLCVILGIIASSAIIQILIWASVPLTVAQDAHIHMRIFPFVPWPDYPLF
jgi:hypothetical protein